MNNIEALKESSLTLWAHNALLSWWQEKGAEEYGDLHGSLRDIIAHERSKRVQAITVGEGEIFENPYMNYSCSRDRVPFDGKEGGKRHVVNLWPEGGEHCPYGCSGCGISQRRTEKPISASEAFGQALLDINGQIDEGETNTSDQICIYVNGGFFTDKIISPESRKAVLKATKEAGYTSLIIEANAETITEENLSILKEHFGENVLIAMGLEFADPLTRQVVWGKEPPLYKSNFLATAQKAVELIHEHGMKVRANIVIGAPGATSQEAIKSATQTAQVAKLLGFDNLDFMVGQLYWGGRPEIPLVSLYDVMHETIDPQTGERFFKPLFLWDVYEVIKRTAELDVPFTIDAKLFSQEEKVDVTQETAPYNRIEITEGIRVDDESNGLISKLIKGGNSNWREWRHLIEEMSREIEDCFSYQWWKEDRLSQRRDAVKFYRQFVNAYKSANPDL